MKLLNRREERRVANSVIADPEQHTIMDDSGGVRSIQAANVDMPEDGLVAIWSPMYLERLARTYWKYLSRVTLGLIRVVYGPTERLVVLIARPFVLLRFQAPEYELSGDRGIVRWRIRDGILVAASGRSQGYLEIDVRRGESDKPGYQRAHVEVEVANFYPAIATWIARWFYQQTQSRIHVLVTHGFLRSLAKLELEPSAVGRFENVRDAEAAADLSGATEPPGTRAVSSPAAGEEEINVGDTPWLLVGGLAAASVAVVVAVILRARE